MTRDWLVTLRKSKEYTQEEVARQAFIGRSFYSQIERGTRNPSLPVAMDLSKILGINPDTFFIDDVVQTTKPTDASTITQCDLDLRYTWLFNVDSSIVGKSPLGRRLDEMFEDKGTKQLMALMQEVAHQSRSKRRIITLDRAVGSRTYVFDCKPLTTSDGEIVGVTTIWRSVSEVDAALFGSDLSKLLDRPRDGHVLYLYEDPDIYVKNLASFILAGIDSTARVVVIESQDVANAARQLLRFRVSRTELSKVLWLNAHEIFESGFGPGVQNVSERVVSMITPYVKMHQDIRMWSHLQQCEALWVDGRPNDLEECDKLLDGQLHQSYFMRVCAYNSNIVPSAFQMSMMRKHNYLMSDSEIVYSPLCHHDANNHIFPSFCLNSAM